MSAAVLPFTGRWHGRVEPTSAQSNGQARALFDARAIMTAKRDNDDWTARLLLAMLETLTSKQLSLLEFRLMGPQLNSEAAVQALALVQLATGDKAHRERVKSALDAFAAGEAE